MTKEARLSFRISDSLSERVDKAITASKGQIKDRSEFGTKAVMFYLDYIESVASEKQILLKSILALARHAKVSGHEFKRIQAILDKQIMIPAVLSSGKGPEHHPYFEKLLNLRTKLDEDAQKELSQKLQAASYSNIEDLFREYQTHYYLGPKKEKLKETIGR